MVPIEAAFIVVAALVALPCAVLFAQCFVAALPRRRGLPPADVKRPKIGVLVPAHDEEAVIEETLRGIRAQLAAGDRLLVIADNCSDTTAALAERTGAEVLVRNDPARRGKGYALQSGVEMLKADPPDVVIVIDADCRLGAGCLETLAAQVGKNSRPAQASYLMMPPRNARAVDVVSSLAVLVKNRVRPSAMARLGLPCLLTGSGSAFPWQVVQSRSLAGGNIVEDMQLGVDLALDRFPPLFCERAVVMAALPDRPAAFVSQRRRWEHGHLQTLLGQAPRLFAGFLKTGRGDLLAMMADLAVPPLSLLAAVDMFVLVTAIAWALAAGSWRPAVVAASAAGLLVASIGIAWWRFARKDVALWTLLTVPVYVLKKLPLYAGFVFHRERTWVRTTRGTGAGSAID